MRRRGHVLKIFINTSGSLAGGGITHLRNLLPAMQPLLAPGEEIVLAGNARVRTAIEAPGDLRWIDAPVAFEQLGKRLAWESRELPALLRESGADVLFHPSNMAVYRSPVPQVTLVHNLAPFLPEIIAEESLYQRLRLRLLRILTIDALRRADETLFVSRWGREQVLAAAGRTRGEHPVVYFGSDHAGREIDDALLAQWDLAVDGFILSVSHFYKYKRLEALVDAYVALGPLGKRYPLVLAGEPYDAVYAAELRARAAAADGRVIFTGGLGPLAVATLLRRCALFVFTSAVENLPITLLEAMRAGAPIVTSRVCSMPEVCGDGARYVDVPDAPGYGREISALLESPSERAALRQRAEVRGEAFSWANAAAGTLEALRRVAR